MTSTVTVRHNAEMGHRLPHLPGKCQSLHGHSWWFEVEIEGPVRDDGTVLEFAHAKAHLRHWVDSNLDHGLALGYDDPLATRLAREGKVFMIPDGWPTVERMAEEVGRVMDEFCQATTDCRVIRCTAQETHVNAATWRP